MYDHSSEDWVSYFVFANSDCESTTIQDQLAYVISYTIGQTVSIPVPTVNSSTSCSVVCEIKVDSPYSWFYLAG